VPAKGSIYTLSDPRDGTVRYVGKTIKPLPERLDGHLSSPTNPAMQVWIGTLRVQQLAPVITRIASVPENRLSSEEERLIREHIRDGHRLFNAPHFRQYLEDLAPTARTQPPRRRGIRYLIYAALLGAYLWSVGFGLLVRREVLPRLSADDGARFWHAYLARPLSLIAVHTVAVFAVWLLSVICHRWWEARRPARLAAAAARALDAALPPRDA
jgi:hypothetical protein